MNSQRSEWCWYCGELAASRDHVKPQSATNSVKSFTVPCCRHCNSVLGDIALYSDAERGRYIANRLIEKLKECADPEWEDNEIEELGYNLKTVVLRTIKHRLILERRVGYAVRRWGRYVPPTSVSAVSRKSTGRPLAALRTNDGWGLDYCTEKLLPPEDE